MNKEQAEELKQKLIEAVVEQIKMDIEMGDVEAIEELLRFCPTKNLVNYLPEEDWEQFFELEQFNS
jgi:hypothetical protein